MLDLLDAVLGKLLNATPLNAVPLNAVFQELYDAEVSFITPEKTNIQGLRQKNTVNLFLYEIKENREFREASPITERRNGRAVRSRAPLRVDCGYMVTAWSKDSDDLEVEGAHRLLGEAFNWLSRFPVIPEGFLLAAGVTGQVFAPPTMVAQMDGAKSAGEFWSALGIPPRPYFNLIVTICMDLDQSVGDSIVTTVSSRYQAGNAAFAEELVMIGGTVRDSGGNPVADAWVRLEPPNPQVPSQIRVTDAAGHFIFEDVARGAGYTLRARAQGHPENQVPNVEVPALSGEYDVVV